MTPYRPFVAAALAAILLAAAGLAPAQATRTRPDPADAQAPSATLVHRSALADYRRHGVEAPPVAWREANDAVGRIGGWRAYAREASAVAASAPRVPGDKP